MLCLLLVSRSVTVNGCQINGITSVESFYRLRRKNYPVHHPLSNALFYFSLRAPLQCLSVSSPYRLHINVVKYLLDKVNS